MLVEMQCGEFKSNGIVRKPIRFHEGLNAILGDMNRSNSIGKSTLLMIIDFVFGGDDYIKKCADVQKKVDRHIINFTFKFGDELYYFSRSNADYLNVLKCDKNYKHLEKDYVMTIGEYRNFLKEKYGINVDDLSWRSAVSRFSRVYQRDTIDEEKPLSSAKRVTDEEAIKEYMKLFDRYRILENLIKVADLAEDKKTALIKSQRYDYVHIANTKKEYSENERKIAALELKEKELAENSDRGLLDLDSVKAHRLSELNDEMSKCNRMRTRIQSQRNAIKNELKTDKKDFRQTYAGLKRFFPGIDLKPFEEIDQFHKQLMKVLSDEFNETESNLASSQMIIEERIAMIKGIIESVENVPNVSQAVLKEYSEIATRLKEMREANDNYNKLNMLKKDASETAKARDEATKAEISYIEATVNDSMRNISYQLVKNMFLIPPTLRFEKLKKYTFTTPNDGGSGAKFRGVVIFDLANLEIAPIPFIIHDSDILDPIEKPVLTEIVKAYDAQAAKGKQVFAAFRSLDFYEAEAQDIIDRKKVIELSSGANALFGWTWNKETEDKKDEKQ